ncbi:hypothetical protein FVK32_20405 [Escherichia coli]|nr:hypothetical protein [Escherichia coli]
MRQQQDEPGRFSICSRQAAVVHFIFFTHSGITGSSFLVKCHKYLLFIIIINGYIYNKTTG